MEVDTQGMNEEEIEKIAGGPYLYEPRPNQLTYYYRDWNCEQNRFGAYYASGQLAYFATGNKYVSTLMTKGRKGAAFSISIWEWGDELYKTSSITGETFGPEDTGDPYITNYTQFVREMLDRWIGGVSIDPTHISHHVWHGRWWLLSTDWSVQIPYGGKPNYFVIGTPMWPFEWRKC